MNQNLENKITSKIQVKNKFLDYFYQIEQDRYQAGHIQELTVKYRNLTKGLDELSKLQQQIPKTANYSLLKASKNWNSNVELISNKENTIDIYVNRIEKISKKQIPIDQILTLYNMDSKLIPENNDAIKLAGILTGNLKIEILEEIESIIENSQIR